MAGQGLVPGDEEIAQVVRGTGRPVLLAINKTDDKRAAAGALDLYRLGFDPVIEVSAEHGRGVGDLMDEIVRRLPARPARRGRRPHRGGRASRRARAGELAVAIVGRPNAGKSSLVNRLLREDRMIVSETPGTTRDPVDSVLQLAPQEGADRRHRRHPQGRPGRPRRRGRVAERAAGPALDRPGRRRRRGHRRALPAPPTRTRRSPAKPWRPAAAIVVAVNKWDLVEDRTPEEARAIDDEIRRRLPFLDFAPILHISAVTGAKTPRLLETHRPRGGGAPAPGADAGAEPLHRRRHRRAAAGRRSAAAPSVCCSPRRPAWPRRPSCSSPTSPPRCTSPTCATSPTGCARSTASRDRRSASMSAAGRGAGRRPAAR